MSVYRCTACGLLAEELVMVSGTKMPCARCTASVTLFDTVFYLGKLLERYQIVRRELEAFRRDENDGAPPAAAPASVDALQSLKEAISSTLLLATEAQHQPLQDWLAERQIKTVFDYAKVDTTGFFDEAAQTIGGQYELLRSALEQLRYAYRQDWTWINIDLASKSPADRQALGAALRQLYSHTFFARYAFNKQKASIGLTLQPSPLIRRFFDGDWLEWWALMRMLEICLERGVAFSCGRGVQVELHGGELRELDVAFLLAGKFPVFVECKSGEFRADIDKYVRLRRRLNIGRSQFVICSPDLDDDQAKGLTAMYDLSFVNLQSFASHIAGCVEPLVDKRRPR